jgi:hypothetical protein
MRPLRCESPGKRSLALVAAILAAAGCSNRPGRVTTPKINARAAGQAAMKEYDRDGDGVLVEAELKQCPALLRKRAEIDLDHDDRISAEEVEQRVRAWQDTRVGFITGYKCKVLLNGQPMAGARVELVPEGFLGGAIKCASGTVDPAGIASLAIAAEELPDDLRGLHGVQFGMYRVRITHPRKSIPERFIKGTELGCEIFPIGDPEFMTFNVLTK